MSTIDKCPTPDPCDDQQFTVTASATYPESDLSWRVMLPLAEFTIYRNATYLLISLLISAISIMFTRAADDGDVNQIDADIQRIQGVLNEIINRK